MQTAAIGCPFSERNKSAFKRGVRFIAVRKRICDHLTPGGVKGGRGCGKSKKKKNRRIFRLFFALYAIFRSINSAMISYAENRFAGFGGDGFPVGVDFPDLPRLIVFVCECADGRQ